MIKIEDVLKHKLSECDRRILAEVEEIEINLATIRAEVRHGFNSSVNIAVRTPRLQELLTERSTLRAVLADVGKVEGQEVKP